MRKPLLHLSLIILLSGFFSACAQQPVQPISAERQEIDCAALAYDSPNREHCNQHSGADDYDDHSEGASLFGYVIFRAVVEGLVHGIVHGIIRH